MYITVVWDVIVSSDSLANIYQTTRRHIIYCKSRENIRCKALIIFLKSIKWLVFIMVYYYNFYEEESQILNTVTCGGDYRRGLNWYSIYWPLIPTTRNYKWI
jgi:hypothetical protein